MSCNYRISDLENLSKEILSTELLYFFGLIISEQSTIDVNSRRNSRRNNKVYILPENYELKQNIRWEIPESVNFLMIPIRESGVNSVLIFINPKLAYSATKNAIFTLVVLVYSGISLSPTIIHICNQYNSR